MGNGLAKYDMVIVSNPSIATISNPRISVEHLLVLVQAVDRGCGEDREEGLNERSAIHANERSSEVPVAYCPRHFLLKSICMEQIAPLI